MSGITGFYRVHARFEDATGAPLRGAAYKVKLYDKDPLKDDFLGESALDETGTAAFTFTSLHVKSVDSPGETKPDLYFVVEREGKEIFRSPVHPDVDFEKEDPVSKRKTSLTQEFGPFRLA